MLGVVLFLLVVFISGVLGQEPPLPLVWARSSAKGKSFFKAPAFRVSQAGTVISGVVPADLEVEAGMTPLAGDEFVIADGVDLLAEDGVDLLDGDRMHSNNGDGADILDDDGVEFLAGDGVLLLDGD